MNKLNNELKKNYTIIPNAILRNQDLSDRARFLFCYMASMPEDWQFYSTAISKDLNMNKDTLRKYMDELIEHGYIIRELRRIDGKFNSYDYTINFLPQPKNTVAEKNRYGKKPLRKNSPLTKKDIEQRNTLINKDLNKECENDFSPPFTKVANGFTRQGIIDTLNTEEKEKEKSCAKKEKETTETYAAFCAFCSTYEELAKVTLPVNRYGNYMMSAKDGANCKKLISWMQQVSSSPGTAEEMIAAFTRAAWHIADKWQKNNFNITMIYSNANQIYTKYHYQNPAAQAKRKQDEIDKLVNEFTL